MLDWLGVFFLVAAIDLVWVKYIQACAERKTLWAASLSTVVWGAGALVVLGYTQDHTLLLPGLLGAFVGTFLGIKYDKKGEE